jgi:hypothetical protein
MKLTTELIMKGSNQKKTQMESPEEFLKRITNLSLFGLGVDSMVFLLLLIFYCNFEDKWIC